MSKTRFSSLKLDFFCLNLCGRSGATAATGRTSKPLALPTQREPFASRSRGKSHRNRTECRNKKKIKSGPRPIRIRKTSRVWQRKRRKSRLWRPKHRFLNPCQRCKPLIVSIIEHRFKICPKLSKSDQNLIKICQQLSKSVNISQNLSKSVKI